MSHLRQSRLHCHRRIFMKEVIHIASHRELHGYPQVKTQGAVKMIYQDGELFINEYKCSKQEMLAIANLLLPDYRSIVGAARDEQRQKEAEHHVRKVDRIEAL